MYVCLCNIMNNDDTTCLSRHAACSLIDVLKGLADPSLAGNRNVIS